MVTEPAYRYFRVSDIVEPAYYRRTIGHVVEVLTDDGWRDTAFASVTDLRSDARDNDDTFEEITVVDLRRDLDGGERS